MKKILTVAALAVAAAVPAASNANKATAARGGGNFEIGMVISKIGNDPVEIKDFKFKGFTVSCAVGGPVEASGKIGTMKINKAGKFDGNVKKGGAKVHVEGEVKQHGKKAIGFLKASGDFNNAEDCNTKVGWLAEKPQE